MNTQTPATIKLNVPSGMLQHAQNESRRIGISLQDFIRMLMATYFANASSIHAVSHDKVLFDRGMKELESGEYTTITTGQQLKEYLNSLSG